MKKFFLLSGTGRLRRRHYAIGALLIAALQMLVEHNVVSEGLGLIIILACLVGWIYIISARLHDLGYAGWWAWVWLGLQILSLFGEGFTILTSLCCLCLGLTLLFTKGVQEDNEYGPSPYIKENEQVEELAEKVPEGKEITKKFTEKSEIKKKEVVKKKATKTTAKKTKIRENKTEEETTEKKTKNK